MSISINVISDNLDSSNEPIINGSFDVSDEDMNLVYQLSDIREPEKRKANYVRKFKLPGTKNNNRLFSHIFENGYQISPLQPGQSYYNTNSYNPNLRLRAQVILNNNVFFEGNLQLNKINKVDNKLVSYEVTIYGSLGDFFGDIGDLGMNNLDISEYNHTLSRETIVLSWNMRGAGKKIVWKRKSGYSSSEDKKDQIWKYGQLVNNDIGDGYVYPLYYQGGADLNSYVSVDKWAPSLYVYTLFKKIFDKWGWKWKSNFLESELFKRLIVPFSKDSLMITEEQKNKTEFLANVGVRSAANAQRLTSHNSSVANTQTSKYVQFIYDSKTPSPQPYPLAQPSGRDEGSTFDTSTGIWTCPKNGQFRVQSKLHMMIGFETAQTNYAIVGPNVPVTVKIINVDTKAVLGQKSGEWVFVPTVKTSGYYYQTIPVLCEYEGFLSVGTRLAVIVETTIPAGSYAAKTILLGNGQAFNTPISVYDIGFVDDSSYFSATLLDKQLQQGDFMNMNQVLPDMSIKDFITGINRMFNLYWIPTGNGKEFIIEPRDDIYRQSQDKIVDWTKRVDNGEILSIEPLFDLTSNKMLYTYKGDTDYLNKDYTDTYTPSIYGEQRISIENDFQVDENKVETTFSTSPLYNPPFNTGIALTAFITKDGTKFKRATPKPRILYWGGMKKYSGTPVEIQDVFGTSGTYIMQQYNPDEFYFPYAGHLDDTVNPTIDLNYGFSKSYYFTYTTLTDNNLYNKYWRSYTEEIIDPNQHLLTCKVNIPGQDMIDFDLRTVVQVDNVYYRINKITYNPLIETGEVELFKLKKYEVFQPSYLTSGGLPIGFVEGSQIIPETINTGGGGWSPWRPDVNPWIDDTPIIWGTPWRDTEWRRTGQAPQWRLSNTNSPTTNTGNVSISPAYTLPTQPRTSTRVGTNTYSDVGSVQVNGEWNVVAPTAQFVTINGSFNNVTDSAKSINIVGDYNTILPGVTNVNIVGDNIVAKRSNTSYVDGIEIGNGRVQTSQTQIAKSPTDLKGGVIMGGKNSVGDFTTRTSSRVINGNVQVTGIQPKNTSPLGPKLPVWSGLINNA